MLSLSTSVIAGLNCLRRQSLKICDTYKESEKSSKPRNEVEHESFPVAHSAGDKDGEVAEFMRQFVQKNGDGSGDSRRVRGGKGGREGDTVHEIVNTVADQNQRRYSWYTLIYMFQKLWRIVLIGGWAVEYKG